MRKSSKKFIIFSGLYLFTLIFLLLSRPHSGYPATVEEVISYYTLYFPLWGLIALTVFIAKKGIGKSWHEFIFGKRTLFWLIILSVLVGFVFNFDYQRQAGCLNQNEAMFSPAKFIISLGSILLLSIAYYFHGSILATSLLITEFLLWTFKSTYFNVSLDLFFPGYFTMICWSLRCAFIIKVLNEKTSDTISPNTKTTRYA